MFKKPRSKISLTVTYTVLLTQCYTEYIRLLGYYQLSRKEEDFLLRNTSLRALHLRKRVKQSILLEYGENPEDPQVLNILRKLDE